MDLFFCLNCFILNYIVFRQQRIIIIKIYDKNLNYLKWKPKRSPLFYVLINNPMSSVINRKHGLLLYNIFSEMKMHYISFLQYWIMHLPNPLHWLFIMVSLTICIHFLRNMNGRFWFNGWTNDFLENVKYILAAMRNDDS